MQRRRFFTSMLGTAASLTALGSINTKSDKEAPLVNGDESELRTTITAQSNVECYYNGTRVKAGDVAFFDGKHWRCIQSPFREDHV